jgi:hypothetical protein
LFRIFFTAEDWTAFRATETALFDFCSDSEARVSSQKRGAAAQPLSLVYSSHVGPR